MVSEHRVSHLLGLIGAPIARSASPAMREAAGQAIDLRCGYPLIEVARTGSQRLRAMVEGVRTLTFSGVNTTYRYHDERLLDATYRCG